MTELTATCNVGVKKVQEKAIKVFYDTLGAVKLDI